MKKDNNRRPDSCPFCNEKIQKFVFLESENFLAIYNIAPVLPGHSLIIPKNHIASFIDLDQQQMADFLETTRYATRVLLKAFKTDAFDLSVQEKPEAGQTIEHLHLHIVPRIKGDMSRPGDWYPVIHKNDEMIIDNEQRMHLPDETIRTIVQKLKEVASGLAQRV